MNDLESLIQNGSEYLKREFDLKSPEVEIKFCKQREWTELTIKNQMNSGLGAFYHPRENRVYALDSISLPDLLHEVFGHALFAEWAILGKKLKYYSFEIESFESKYDIPRDVVLSIKHSDGEKFRVEKNTDFQKSLKNDCGNHDTNCEYFLFCDTKDEEVQKYVQLKMSYKTLFEKVRPVQEGFAVWMEKLILEGLGMGNLWKKRKEQIQQNKYYNDCFEWFNRDIEHHGIFSILYGLGFPKSSDKGILTRFAKENLKSFEGLKYLIRYGSGKRDLDMIAVYDDSIKIQTQHIYMDNAADISLLNESVFLKKLKLFDIELTEPVLTGTLLVGDEKKYWEIKERLINTKPSEQAVEYAKIRTLETYNSAVFFLDQHRYKSYNQLINTGNFYEIADKLLNNQNPNCTSEDLLYALVNLSFSLSYDSTAKHYSTGNKAIDFEKLLKSRKALRDVIEYIKNVENNREKLTEERTKYFLEFTKNNLLGTYAN